MGNEQTFPVRSQRVRRIRECKAHVECIIPWTKPAGSASLVLGEGVSISAHKELEKIKVTNKIVKLNPPLYFSFKEDRGTRKWMFAEIGKITTVTEKDEKIEITSENL